MTCALNFNQFLVAGGIGLGGDLKDAVFVDEANMNQQVLPDIEMEFRCFGSSAQVSAGKVIAVDQHRRAILFDQATNQAQIVHEFWWWANSFICRSCGFNLFD